MRESAFESARRLKSAPVLASALGLAWELEWGWRQGRQDNLKNGDRYFTAFGFGESLEFFYFDGIQVQRLGWSGPNRRFAFLLVCEQSCPHTVL